jgi:uroporphyrinogen-III synthase
MAESADRPLEGIGVLVTRPQDQADELCALIEAAGGRALRWPLLEIAPVENPERAGRLLNQPEGWDWVIFVSANAVRYGLSLAARSGAPPGWRRVAAVGEATARALVQAGIRVDLIPKPQFNSESLLAAPELADVAGQRLLIVRGEGGRELLADVLGARGAETAYAEVYRRTRPVADGAEWVENWRRSVDVAVVTSGEALHHLMALLGEAGAELADRTPLVVIGARLAALARERGWRRVAAADPASDRAIANTLIALRRCGELRRDRPVGPDAPEQDL